MNRRPGPGRPGTRPARFRRRPRRPSVGILIPARRRRRRRHAAGPSPPAGAVGQSGVRRPSPPRWRRRRAAAHRGAAPRRTKRRPLGHRVGPDSPPWVTATRRRSRRNSWASGSPWRALFLVVLGFLLRSYSPSRLAQRSPDAPAADNRCSDRPRRSSTSTCRRSPRTTRTSERGADRAVRTGRQTCSVVAGAAAQGPPRGGFPGHSRRSGHDPDGAGAVRASLNRDDSPRPGPGAPHFEDSDPDSPGALQRQLQTTTARSVEKGVARFLSPSVLPQRSTPMSDAGQKPRLFIVCHGCVSRAEVGQLSPIAARLAQPWHEFLPFATKR